VVAVFTVLLDFEATALILRGLEAKVSVEPGRARGQRLWGKKPEGAEG
jgi:hypothetical protein